MSVLLLIILCVLSPEAARAQGSGISPTGTGGTHVIQGHVYLPSGRRAENVQVKLQSFGAGELSVMSSGNGEFTFHSLVPGRYNVVIDAGEDYERAEESVFIDTDVKISGISTPSSRPYTLVIHLRPKPKAREDKPSVIDAAAVAEVPESARKLYEKGLDFARGGDSKKAIENLRSAISTFPSFPAALDELGVQYLKTGQADKAAESLTAAVKLTPDAFRPNLNLGIALLEMKRFEAAESQLKTAILASASSPAAHMYLGIALIGEKKSAEAQLELEAAANTNSLEVAKAHYYLGGIYWANREYGRAADELETYLKLVPKAPEADKVRQTIKELRSRH
ncbi:MAG: hypothetical protein DMG15_21505 [Acidobacteria bacterium]|nr:MAG: hypothetical protein DMG15_21505 [Acidobacteriota bacterium]